MTAEELTAAETSETLVAEEATDVEPTEHVEPAEHAADDASPPGRLKRFAARVKLRRLKRFAARVKQLASGRVLAVLTSLLVVASLSLLALLFYVWYRPDQATDAAAAKAAISAASEGTVAILSYSPDTLDHDFSSAKSHLTAPFLSYYDQFTSQIVAPAAKMRAVKTSAVVLRAAVKELHPDSAVVLLFVNQSTQSADRPEPALRSSSVTVTLKKADGKWLISSFDPV